MAKMSPQEYVAELVAKARAAQAEFEAKFTTQRAVDEVMRCVGKPIFDHAQELAEDAQKETGMGTVEWKVNKLIGYSLPIWNYYKGHKSMGIIENWRNEPGVTVYARPIGVIGVVLPSTNPICTMCNNVMGIIKCRNAAICCPHPSAKNVSVKAVNLIRAAFKEIGAPEDLMQVIDPEYASLETTSALLAACDVNVATGGPGMVRSVYSCGKPGFGVGQGNDQEIVCPDWEDYTWLANAAVSNREWDNGVPCTGEQVMHIPADKEALYIECMQKEKAFLVEDPAVIQKLREVIFPDGKNINRQVVGRSPATVMGMVGVEIPEDSRVLLCKIDAVAEEDVLCKEVLFPFIRYRLYKSFEEAVDVSYKNYMYEGKGHSSSIWTNIQENIDVAANKLPVSRLHVNQSPQGNLHIMPQMNGLTPTCTLGCGFWSGNSTNENLSWYQFMNTTRVTTLVPAQHELDFEKDWDNYDICVMTK